MAEQPITILIIDDAKASRDALAGMVEALGYRAITTDNAYEPVVIEGEAALIDDMAEIGAFVIELNRKYRTDYSIGFFNPTDNACFQVRPRWAFGLAEADFTGTPTRWTFPPTSG